MTERPRIVLEPSSPAPRHLRVIFHWQADRYGHDVEWVEATQSGILLRSVEGVAASDVPQSPPLQQLHVESRPSGQRVALLVGMAGRNHWSLSVEMDASGSNVLFDAACRTHSSDVRLGSRYSLGSPEHWTAMNREETLQDRLSGCRIRTEAVGGFTPAHMQLDRDGIRVEPPVTEGATVRWKYAAILKEARAE